VTQHLVRTVTLQANELVDRGTQQLAQIAAPRLAQSWRLIAGTRENLTVHGERLDEPQRETVTTEMLEQLTGVCVGGAFAEQLANTLRQQALVEYASLMVNPGDRKAALGTILAGEVPAETQRIAGELGVDRDLERDQARRAAVRE
jgi:hypothetical protein